MFSFDIACAVFGDVYDGPLLNLLRRSNDPDVARDIVHALVLSERCPIVITQFNFNIELLIYLVFNVLY